MRVLDAVSISGDGYESAFDEGRLREPGMEYGHKKSSLDTGRAERGEVSPNAQDTDVSNDVVSKIQQNLNELVNRGNNLFDEGVRPRNKGRILLRMVAEAFGMTTNSNSQYAHIPLPNGRTITLRLSNHNASVGNFDRNGEREGISIVVSRNANRGMRTNGTAHVEEFFYSDKKLAQADGNPYVEILRSLKDSVTTGRYKDTTGLAEIQEVNGLESDDKNVATTQSEDIRKSLSGAWSVDGAHVYDMMSEREKQEVLDMVDAKVGSSWTSRFVTNVTNRMRPVNELMQRVVGVDSADDLRKAFGGETPGERYERTASMVEYRAKRKMHKYITPLVQAREI